MAIAWNAIQLALLEHLGDSGLALARQLAMTTYRSEDDFTTRFGRTTESDGTPTVTSYLRYQGEKLVRRFDVDTYRILVRAMDRHDIGAGRGGAEEALRSLAGHGVVLTGVGISSDLLYGPSQVRSLVAAATAAGVEAQYRELESAKGHDAFLTEWAALGVILQEALAEVL
jgi:homoserine O-acetyltransferase